MGRHPELYLDTSLYGSFYELWLSRAGNQASSLASLAKRFPKQLLFGSDVFGSRRKSPHEYADALRASIGFLTQPVMSYKEFKRTAYFEDNKEDKYGPVVFRPDSLPG